MLASDAKYRPDIDGLRAIAILSVVIFHAFPMIMPSGFVGVDVFFVISGYLIGGIILSDLATAKFSFLQFYKRRIRRLLPALLVVYCATVLIGVAFLAPDDFNTLTYTLRASVLLGSNFAFANRTGYFDQTASTSPLIHTWSLSVEEQFYLVIPLLLWLVGRRYPHSAGPILIGLAALSFVATVHGAFVYPDKAFFLPHTRAWELFVGVILARYQLLEGTHAGTRTVIGGVGVLAIVLGIWLPDDFGSLNNLVHVALACAGAAALIESGRFEPGPWSRVLSMRPLVYIGLISYPLYLWHWPLLVYSHMFISGQNVELANGAILLAAFALADLTRRLVEMPLRFRLKLGTSAIYASFAAVSAVLVGFSVVSEATKGLPIRFAGPIRAVFATENEWKGSERLKCMSVVETRRLDDRAAPTSPCRLGSDKKPISVVLWGDSHAAAMQPGLSKWLESGGLSGVAVTFNCHPVDLRPSPDGAVICASGRKAILESFLNSEATTLFLVMRWNRQVEGPMPLEPGYRPISDQEKDTRADALSTQLHDLAVAVTAKSKRLVLTYTVPEIPFDVPDTMGVRLNLGLPLPLGPEASEVLKERERTNKAIHKALDEFAVHYVDPMPTFCTDRCAVERNGTPLYFDNNHLSIASTDIIVQMFDSQLGDSFAAQMKGAELE